LELVKEEVGKRLKQNMNIFATALSQLTHEQVVGGTSLLCA